MRKMVWPALTALVLVACGGGQEGAATGDAALSTPTASEALKAKAIPPDPTLAAQPVVLASASPLGNQVLGSVGATADGGYTVAWISGDSTVAFQHFDSSGAKDGPETTLAVVVQAATPSVAAQAVAGSSVAVLADGSVVVAYRVSRDSTQPGAPVSARTGVFFQRFGADSALLQGETEVAFDNEFVTPRSPFVNNVQVAALADGGFVVGWAVARFAVEFGAISSLSLRRYDDQGQPLGNAVAVGDFPALSYSIVPDAHDGFDLNTRQLDFTFTTLFAVRHYDANMAITQAVGPQMSAVLLLPLANGFELFTEVPLGSSRQTLDRQGSPVGQPVMLAFMPLAARELADGSYVVFWLTAGASSISAQRFAADGLPLGEPLALQTGGTLPQVAPLVDVGFAVAWSAAGAAGDTDVFTQRFIEVPSDRKKACLDAARGLKGHERKAFMNACLA